MISLGVECEHRRNNKHHECGLRQADCGAQETVACGPGPNGLYPRGADEALHLPWL